MAPRYIIVEKLNEVYLKLEADADLRRNLSDYFSFEVTGSKAQKVVHLIRDDIEKKGKKMETVSATLEKFFQ